MFETILLRYKLWSFLIFPSSGFSLGFILELLLRTSRNAKYQSIVVHVLTVAVMAIIFIDTSLNEKTVTDIKSKLLYVALNYLFLLGMIFGLLSNII